MEDKLLKSHQIQTKHLQLDQKTSLTSLTSLTCVTSFFCRCPANLAFLVLQSPIFNQMSTHGRHISQITRKLNKKPLITSKDLSENFSLRLLCDVILCRCLTNLTFLVLQCPIFHQMSTHGRQPSQMTSKSN